MFQRHPIIGSSTWFLDINRCGAHCTRSLGAATSAAFLRPARAVLNHALVHSDVARVASLGAVVAGEGVSAAADFSGRVVNNNLPRLSLLTRLSLLFPPRVPLLLLILFLEVSSPSHQFKSLKDVRLRNLLHLVSIINSLERIRASSKQNSQTRCLRWS